MIWEKHGVTETFSFWKELVTVMFKYAYYFLLYIRCHEEAAELAIGCLTPSYASDNNCE